MNKFNYILLIIFKKCVYDKRHAFDNVMQLVLPSILSGRSIPHLYCMYIFPLTPFFPFVRKIKSRVNAWIHRVTGRSEKERLKQAESKINFNATSFNLVCKVVSLAFFPFLSFHFFSSVHETNYFIKSFSFILIFNSVIS